MSWLTNHRFYHYRNESYDTYDQMYGVTCFLIPFFSFIFRKWEEKNETNKFWIKAKESFLRRGGRKWNALLPCPEMVTSCRPLHRRIQWPPRNSLRESKYKNLFFLDKNSSIWAREEGKGLTGMRVSRCIISSMLWNTGQKNNVQSPSADSELNSLGGFLVCFVLFRFLFERLWGST